MIQLAFQKERLVERCGCYSAQNFAAGIRRGSTMMVRVRHKMCKFKAFSRNEMNIRNEDEDHYY